MIAYARPFRFSRSDGKAAPKVDAEALGLFHDAAHFESLHRSMLEFRDQAVAHADWKHYDTELIPTGETVRISNTPVAAAMINAAAGDVLGLLEHVASKLGLISWQEDSSRREPLSSTRNAMNTEVTVETIRHAKSTLEDPSNIQS